MHIKFLSSQWCHSSTFLFWLGTIRSFIFLRLHYLSLWSRWNYTTEKDWPSTLQEYLLLGYISGCGLEVGVAWKWVQGRKHFSVCGFIRKSKGARVIRFIVMIYVLLKTDFFYLFYASLFLPAWVYIQHMHARAHRDQRRGTRVTSCYDLHVGPGNWTWVLYKSSKCC